MSMTRLRRVAAWTVGLATGGLILPVGLAKGLERLHIHTDPGAWAQAVFACLAWLFIYRLERGRDDREVAAAVRAQAERVSVYYGDDGRLVVANLSDQPIRDVRTYLVEDGEPGAVWAAVPARIIGPGRTVPSPVYDDDHKAQREDGLIRYGHDDGPTAAPGVRFTDARDQRWDRRPAAELVRVDDETSRRVPRARIGQR